MRQYLELISKIMNEGVSKKDRTGVGTISIFGYQMRFDLKNEFPIVKAKFTSFRLILTELLWFLKGGTNIKYLHDNDNHIWDEWANENGDLGPVYGSQWRSWPKYILKDSDEAIALHSGAVSHLNAVIVIDKIDQIAEVIQTLKNNPDSRRIIVSAWNVADVPDMKLPPCHLLFQFYTRELTDEEAHKQYFDHRTSLRLRSDSESFSLVKELDEKYEGKVKTVEILKEVGLPTRALSCQVYIRSNDTFLGAPFNISSYALLTYMIAHCVNMIPDELVYTVGDAHLYSNHLEQVKEMLSRELITEKAQLWLNPEVRDIDKFTVNDVKLCYYKHHPSIKADVAV